MIQGNKEFASSSQPTGNYDFRHHQQSVIRVVKSSGPNRRHRENNISSTNGTKVNKIIHTRIRSSRKTAPSDAINDLLSVSNDRILILLSIYFFLPSSHPF